MLLLPSVILKNTNWLAIYKIAPAEKIFVVPLGFNLDKFGVDHDTKRIHFQE